MGLLRHFIQADLAEFEANDVRLRVIGNYKALEPSLVAMIENAIARTAHNSSTTVVVALNYGAQDELTRATQIDRKSTRLKLQSLMRISSAVFCLKKKQKKTEETKKKTH